MNMLGATQPRIRASWHRRGGMGASSGAWPISSIAGGRFSNASRATHIGTRFALTIFCLLGWHFSFAASPTEMLDCSGLPCVSVLAGGQSFKLAIDTGNSVSMLDLSAAKGMGLALTPYTGRDNKPLPGFYRATLKDVSLGNEQLGDIKVLVADLGVSEGKFLQATGTLSYVNLKDRRVVLDYVHHKIQVSKSIEEIPCGANCGQLTYPTFGQGGPPIVVASGFRLNGQPISMQVDTLYEGTMLIYSTSIEKLKLRQEAATTRKHHFPFTDGGVDMLQAKATIESFGSKSLLASAPLYLPTPQVHQPDGMFDGTVGSALFQGHTVTLDFHTNEFWIL